ncbi:LysR family transcriptional regulator [Micrococcales bacterium 31B]|nr:LysR family transcriptional regulator [Micrococcales bacterium 31B]
MLSRHVPDLGALEMLVAIGETGSLSAAGRSLGVSQQAVSGRVAAVESQVGATLLARGPRGAQLTETGHLVVAWARDVLAAAQRLDAGIASLHGAAQRQLNVVASQTIAEHLLPGWLVALHSQQEARGETATLVNLTVTNSEFAAELVHNGAADIGFIESPFMPRGLAHAHIARDEMVVAIAPTHPWSRRARSLTFAELVATPLVTREVGSGTRDALVHLATEAGLEVAPPRLEFNTPAAVRTAVMAGSAPAVLSRLAVADDVRLGRLRLVPVADQRLIRPLSALWLSGRVPPAGPPRDLIAIGAAHSRQHEPARAPRR